MRLHLIAVGVRPPAWVRSGFLQYRDRLPRGCALDLAEIAPGRRTKKGDVQRALRQEAQAMLAAIPAGARVVALEAGGRQWDSAGFAARLGAWIDDGREVALLAGGPDGLAPECRARAEETWSLSSLTFPHALVRVIVAEQVFRACSILRGHPYHRE